MTISRSIEWKMELHAECSS